MLHKRESSASELKCNTKGVCGIYKSDGANILLIANINIIMNKKDLDRSLFYSQIKQI